VIVSFGCRETERIFGGEPGRKFRNIHRAALRKLTILDAAEHLSHLAGKGNSLEALKRDRAGQHSIRINEQFRICFRWQNGNAFDVEINDYHA